MGENGAGKSTLIKAITGALQLTSGELLLDGSVMHFGSPHDAQEAGVRAVYQEIDLLPNISVAENISPRHRADAGSGLIDWRRCASGTRRTRRPGPGHRPGLDPRRAPRLSSSWWRSPRDLDRGPGAGARRADLEPGPRRVRRAVPRDPRPLGRGRRDRVRLDFLDEVYEICDRVTVLRDGKLVGEYLDPASSSASTWSRRCSAAAPSRCGHAPGCTSPTTARSRSSSARSVSVGSGISGADVDLIEGEVLGVAGLLGSGRTELARAITGIDKLDAGIIRIQGCDESLAGGPAVRDLARGRLLLGEPPQRGHHQRSQRAGEHHARAPGRARRAAPDPAGPAARARAQLGRRPRHPATATWTVRPAPSPAATSRRCSWPGCWRCPRGSWCSTSRPAASTSAPRSRCRTWSASSPTTACRSCSSRPSSRRCCGSATGSLIVQDGRILDTVPSEELTADSLTALVARPEAV